ncbi:hypothetical protein GYMLUDRAFT_46279 [Collybiopsis luxurians FD-317 M1]|uniref:DUF6697 domain-containing protein n=1 Tax=Collybiopsis luxurians FD-317 M1 TaxID=944289 RepID=A0A0D0CPV5_9AGAR|nr:hypothetical protein GYMLUDRAFT_46279 [Collybiopsis luxurians FD-317 M1]
MERPENKLTLEELLAENARLQSRIKELEAHVKVKNQDVELLKHRIKAESELDDAGFNVDRVKLELKITSTIPANSTKKRTIKIKSETGPNKRPKMEFVGVVLTQNLRNRPVSRVQRSHSISPGPGDTESEGEDKDTKIRLIQPKMEPNDDDVIFISQNNAIPTELEQKPKIKKDMDLDDITVQTRLRGYATFSVTLEDSLRSRTFSRAYITSVFGGSQQESFPRIGGRHLARHGRKHWMFLNNCKFQPNAPGQPGEPGLFFDSMPFSAKDEDKTIRHLFICLEPSKWQYAGDYQSFVAESLTQTEWVMQTPKFRSNWSTVLHTDGWGRTVRAMIHLRKQLGREPTEEEVGEALGENDSYSHITAEEIDDAYSQGQQHLGILAVKCVGYDESLQRELIEKLSSWTPPPPRKKGKTNTKSAAKKAEKKAKKRSRIQDDDSDSSDDDEYVEGW